MMTTLTPPKLLPFDGSGIPQFLKDQKRWAPWRAVFDEKRGKYDKIPCNPKQAEYGISTAAPELWGHYDEALDAFNRGRPILAGVGYVMTKPHGVVGLDLDKCLSDGVIADWAVAIVRDMGSYTEVSPSGRGLRIFVEGEAADWTNHQVGIEVYGGTAPRFLTLTGIRVPGTPAEVAKGRGDKLVALRKQYGSARKVEVEYADMPEVLPPMLTPDIADLEIPYYARDFLETGETRGADRSTELFATAVALYQTGLGDDEVLSVLVHNPHTMEVALDHRRQDSDRATLYLWKEHCAKAKGRSASNVASPEDFEVIHEQLDAEGKPLLKFQFKQAALYAQLTPVAWAVKKVLPLAEIAVIYGASGAGKSFFALDLVMAVARGVEWRGNKVRQCNVAYVCAEGAGGFAMRVKAYAEHNQVDLATVPLHILGSAPNITEMSDVGALIASIKALGRIDIVVLDTWAQVTAGADENSGKDMGKALGHCKVLHAKTGAMVVLIAHSGKDESRGVRGWSGMPAAFDASICVERNGEYRSASIKKAKDGPGEGDEYAFKLNTVVLGQDEDGDDITSCVLLNEVAVPREKRQAEPKGSVQRVVMRIAIALTEMPGAVYVNHLIDSAVNELPQDPAKRDQRRRHVMRAIDELVAANRLSATNGEISVI